MVNFLFTTPLTTKLILFLSLPVGKRPIIIRGLQILEAPASVPTDALSHLRHRLQIWLLTILLPPQTYSSMIFKQDKRLKSRRLTMEAKRMESVCIRESVVMGV